MRRGQKGFTLIELLVVVAILGVLAAVMVPNVGRFLGRGTVEAANTEASGVLTAVMAAMADNNKSTLTAGGTVGPAHASAVTDGAGVALDITPYFQGNLQATYTIGADGAITAGAPEATGKWSSLTHTAGTGWQ